MDRPMALPASTRMDTVWMNGLRGRYEVQVLRLDTIHPLTGGNKWFKLQENIRSFQSGSFSAILSFGGPYSNHIAALAEAGRLAGIPTIGIIRGEADPPLNLTLSRAADAGMHLHFVSRSAYRELRAGQGMEALLARYGKVYVIPEGGSNKEGVEGCKAIAGYIPDGTSDVLLALGTGATYAGLALATPPPCRLLGLKVLEAKQENFIFQYVKQDPERHLLLNQYIFGAYARSHPELEHFVNQWNTTTAIPIEPVYTGRLFFGLQDLLEKGFFDEAARIVVIHSGGMQYLTH